jgi:hypothetical protein
MGVRPHILDKAVKEARAHKSATMKENKPEEHVVSLLSDPVPWDEPVNGGVLLEEVSKAAAAHLVLPGGGADTIALWSIFAHAHDCFDISPLLAAISPTPECGKTTIAYPCSLVLSLDHCQPRT